MTRIRKAVFPVAGLGTRFLPATKAVPKELLPLVDRPLIDYAIDEARAAGIEQFIFVIARGKEAIETHVSGAPALERELEAKGKTEAVEAICRSRLPEGSAVFIRQEQPLGLGHAVWCTRHLIEREPFAVLLPDDVIVAEKPCLAQMASAHHARSGNIVATMDVGREAISAYGALDVLEEDGRLARAVGMVEKPAPEDAPSTLAVIGRYILQPSVLDALGSAEPGAGGEIQLTDAIDRASRVSGLWGLKFEGERFDCGTPVGFLQATIALGLSRGDLRNGIERSLEARKSAPAPRLVA